jgi:predicted nuclease with TOPRIM domain
MDEGGVGARKGGQGQVVKHLQAELELETKSRKQQQVFNSKLQEEYDMLLKKLAAAELHIDRLRLRANVDVNRRFILSHDSIQSSVLHQSLHTQGPTGWGDGVDKTADPASGTSLGTEVEIAKSEREEIAESQSYSLDDSARDGIVPEQKPVSVQGYSHVSPSHGDIPSEQHPFEDQAHVPRNISQSLLQDLEAGDSTTSVPHFLLSQTLSEGHTENLSQMSTGYIKTHASAESQHLSQIFRIRSLQEQIASLKEKLRNNQSSFEELSEDLGRILDEHEALTGNFALSREQLNAIQEKYKGKASSMISQRKTALENEVSGMVRKNT